MHEASYALSIIEAVLNELNKRSLRNVKVTKVYLEIGELSLIDETALKNSFQAYAKGSPLEDAELVIKIVPSKFKCKVCGSLWGFKDMFPNLEVNIPIIHMYPHLLTEILKCPKCGSNQIEILQGEEFRIVGIEYEGGEEEENPST